MVDIDNILIWGLEREDSSHFVSMQSQPNDDLCTPACYWQDNSTCDTC